MKKWSFMALLLLSLFGILACNSESVPDVLDRNSDIYAFAAISSVDLLVYSNQTVAHPLASSNGPLVGDQLDELNQYLNMMEKFLGDGDAFSFELSASDRAEYSSKVTFTATDLVGDPVVYILYYNESPIDESESDETEETEETSTETWDEVETRLVGVLVVGEIEYVVEGKKEIEAGEAKIDIESKIDEFNYVRVISKVEGSERKFEYRVVTDGILVQSSKLKFSEEDNKTKFDLAYTSGNTEGEFTFKQEIEDGETFLKIRYAINTNGVEESGDIKILVVVDPVTGETVYTYRVKSDDGSEAEVEKDRDEHDDVDTESKDESEA